MSRSIACRSLVQLAVTMAPILCMIRDTELLFAKKLTAQEKQLGPGRLKRMVRKFLKKIRPGERIMFVGISSQPYRARAKPLQQIYERLILFPRPNYGSRRSENEPLAFYSHHEDEELSSRRDSLRASDREAPRQDRSRGIERLGLALQRFHRRSNSSGDRKGSAQQTNTPVCHEQLHQPRISFLIPACKPQCSSTKSIKSK